MNKNIKVTIGIPVYKSADNIGRLLLALSKQKETNFSIKSIVCYIDAPGDDTPGVVLALAKKHKRIRVFNRKQRKGMAYGFKFMLNKFRDDVFVLLNDDILVTSKDFISNLVQPFINERSIGLVSGNPQPLKPKNFIQNAITSTFRSFERTRYSFDNGNNGLTCDGKIIALSENLISKLKFPQNMSNLGNVDSFLFLSCKKYGFTYKHARTAIAYFEFPDNFHDYVNWTTRNNSNKYVMFKLFGDSIQKEYEMPMLEHIQSRLIETIRNPLGSIFIFFAGSWTKMRARSYSNHFSATWDVVSSTKKRLG